MRPFSFRIWLFLIFLPVLVSGQEAGGPDQGSHSAWADSVLRSLSLEQKIGQLILARANKDNSLLPEIPELIRTYGIGGVVFFKGTPVRQVLATNAWQKMSTVPLFVAIDAERGLAMRLDSTFGYPYMMTLGACRDDSLVYRMGCRIGQDCRRMGIHINFAPVVDLNSNPKNPVINVRSFGQNRDKVTRKAGLYIDGLRRYNILHTAKHFPGHGDTDTDSHRTLPVINHPRSLLDSVDLYPYRELARRGLDGIMAAHLFVPSLDSSTRGASSLSRPILTDLLRKEIGFTGLLFTDALEMKGVTNYYQAGEIEVRALLAGNDILLMPQDVPRAVASVRRAVDSCMIWPEDIDSLCLRVLRYKEQYIRPGSVFTDTAGLYRDLNHPSGNALSETIIRSALTLVRNDQALVPVLRPDTLSLATVVIGASGPTDFDRMAAAYSRTDRYYLPWTSSRETTDSLLNLLGAYDLVIAAMVNTSISTERGFGLSENGIEFLDCLQDRQRTVFVLFGNPYALGRMIVPVGESAVLAAYQDNPDFHRIAAQAVFGAIPISGRLPVAVNNHYPEGAGTDTESTGLLQYVSPEAAGIDPEAVRQADAYVRMGIDTAAYPGCQVLCAWHGKVFYHKAFGKPSRDDTLAVTPEDLYDLASVTKIAGTTLALMKLAEENRVDLDERIARYLPYLRKSNKRHLVIRDILAHQARLKPWIPFHERVLQNGRPDTNVFRTSRDSVFCIPVAGGMFMHQAWKDSLRKAIAASPLEKKSEYKYSDLGFYLLNELIERVSGQTADAFLEKHFYKPLRLSTMGFNPLGRFPLSRIIPTELDTVFRRQLVRGFVHDPGAAMLGGVAGHAGLFSTASDLAVIMQMLINGGQYGGLRFLSEKTVREFTSFQFPEAGNRRGLGFDKPLFSPAPDGPCCVSASPRSFGHSGFTGTYAWADPENQLVFVFLSNRVNPDASNNKLAGMNIRTNLQELFYQMVERAKPEF